MDAAKALKSLGHTMPVALARIGLVAGEGDPVALILGPAPNPRQGFALMRKAIPFVGVKQRVVIGLRLKFAPLLRCDA
jgi:hypothetical protein